MRNTTAAHAITPSAPGSWAYCTTCGKDINGDQGAYRRHLRTKGATIARRLATAAPRTMDLRDLDGTVGPWLILDTTSHDAWALVQPVSPDAGEGPIWVYREDLHAGRIRVLPLWAWPR